MSYGSLRKRILNFTGIVKTQVKFHAQDFILVHFVKLEIYFLGLLKEIFFVLF